MCVMAVCNPNYARSAAPMTAPHENETLPSIALITGAARRIGRAISLALAADGWQILIHHNASSAEAHELAESIERSGGRAVPLQCDLTQQDKVELLLEKCDRVLGRPTCLINNASAFFDDTAASLDAEIWDAHMHANLRAPVFLSMAFARQLPAGENGNIINIIDQRVLRPTPEYFSYTISKAALWTATQTLAQAFAPMIRVNAIGPGPVLQSVHQSDTDFAAEIAGTLLKRACPPDEIANSVRFILASPSMTGQLITLDSGQHLT